MSPDSSRHFVVLYSYPTDDEYKNDDTRIGPFLAKAYSYKKHISVKISTHLHDTLIMPGNLSGANLRQSEVIAVKKRIETAFLALGTVNTITADGSDDEDVVRRAADRVLELHGRLSAFDEGSDISAVSAAAGKSFVKVGEDTLCLIQHAKMYATLTGGVFDPTVRPLVETWNIGKEPASVPDPSGICAALCLTNYRDILIDSRNGSVMLRRPNMALDLGGIAKGFAADEARRILLEGGVTDAVINLGGTVSIIGSAKTIGIRHPDRGVGTPMGRLELTDEAAVTSGSYEKFFMQGGKRYHHLLDPRTGYPADSGLLSVTLLGGSAMELDALTTAVFILGAAEGSRLAAKFGLQAIFVTTDGGVLVTEGLKGSFRLLGESEALYG